jgi:hypothetical protein
MEQKALESLACPEQAALPHVQGAWEVQQCPGPQRQCLVPAAHGLGTPPGHFLFITGAVAYLIHLSKSVLLASNKSSKVASRFVPNLFLAWNCKCQ